VFKRLRSRERVLGSEVGGLLPPGAVLSRRHNALSVYAATRSDIDLARMAIERVARATGLSTDVRVSRWDERAGAWRQVDPPLDGQEQEMDEVRTRETIRQETRELSYLIAWTARAYVEGPLRDLAFATSRNAKVSTVPLKKSVVCSVFVSRSRSPDRPISSTSSPTTPALWSPATTSGSPPKANPGVSVCMQARRQGPLHRRAASLWARQDSNLGPTDYESAALTN
jgi:hypothetical protein